MDLSYTTDNITIDTGTLVIQGRFLEEDTSTTIAVSKNTAYNKLIIEINLDLENTDNNFVQAQYKILSSTNDYPALTQTDIVKNNAGIYQYELARFTTDISGIRRFEDKREFVDYNSIYAMIQEMIENIESGSIYALKTELEDLQETLEAEMESLQQQISTDVQGEINTINGKINTINSNINTINTNVGNIALQFYLQTKTISLDVMGDTKTSKSASLSYQSGYYPIAVFVGGNTITSNYGTECDRAAIESMGNNSGSARFYYHGNNNQNIANISTHTYYVVWIRLKK